jgi:hypothetical protein
MPWRNHHMQPMALPRAGPRWACGFAELSLDTIMKTDQAAAKASMQPACPHALHNNAWASNGYPGCNQEGPTCLCDVQYLFYADIGCLVIIKQQGGLATQVPFLARLGSRQLRQLRGQSGRHDREGAAAAATLLPSCWCGAGCPRMQRTLP